MFSEDNDHRWEPLAEIHFNAGDESSGEDYIYCLCSRVYLRDGVKLYYADKELCSDTDTENFIAKRIPLEEHSHVHFNLNTPYKKDDIISCYGSATHTDNCCSTDEHDPGQTVHSIQPSDSGADLTYMEHHPDFTALNKLAKQHQNNEFEENYLTEDTFEKFWAVNGERIIWASWIKKYSNYINPSYLDENNDLIDKTGNQLYGSFEYEKNQEAEQDMRERKFSYDSKVNPYKKGKFNAGKLDKSGVDNLFVPIGRRRSCSEHDRIVSPRTLTCTDSMTNVTKMSLSSYDATTSSRTTSESTSTDDYSVTTTSSSDDQSNDETRIANDNMEKSNSEEVETDQYWQYLWKKHFTEQYAFHYSNYIECLSIASQNQPDYHDYKNLSKKDSIPEHECENNDCNSCEVASVIEMQNKIDKINLVEQSKPKKKNKTSGMLTNSVGRLLQSILKEEHKNNAVEVVDAAENTSEKTNDSTAQNVNATNARCSSVVPKSNDTTNSSNTDNGGDDPHEQKAVKLKSSHELDEIASNSDNIKSTLDVIGLAVNDDSELKGQLVYRNKLLRLRLPRPKRTALSKKTYFDDEGNPHPVEQASGSLEDREFQSEDEEQSDGITADLKAPSTRAPTTQDCEEDMPESMGGGSSVLRRRRKRRRNPPRDLVDAELPAELRDQPRLRKYWKKRHSLFHRFDEGIQLDAESWFSVSPECVARHAAERCRCDLLVDAFCGAGGNAIQFASTCERVIAIDIDPAKIALARHNAEVYGVADRIEFIVGDFFELAGSLQADVVFLSPPWGGPQYMENDNYDLETMLIPKPASELMSAAVGISHNVALYVPRNSQSEQLVSLAKYCGSVEIEQNLLGRRFIALTAYYGDLVNY